MTNTNTTKTTLTYCWRIRSLCRSGGPAPLPAIRAFASALWASGLRFDLETKEDGEGWVISLF